MHSSFSGGKKPHTQPACYCHRGFQPHSPSCTWIIIDKRNLIGKLLFYFSLRHLQQTNRNVIEDLGSLGHNNKEQIGINFAFFLYIYLQSTPKCCISHPTAGVWTERDQDIIPGLSGRHIYTAFRERGKKAKQSVKSLLQAEVLLP